MVTKTLRDKPAIPDYAPNRNAKAYETFAYAIADGYIRRQTAKTYSYFEKSISKQIERILQYGK